MIMTVPRCQESSRRLENQSSQPKTCCPGNLATLHRCITILPNRRTVSFAICAWLVAERPLACTNMVRAYAHMRAPLHPNEGAIKALSNMSGNGHTDPCDAAQAC